MHEHDRERNLAVVRATLDKLDVRVPMDVPGIARGKFRACDDFLRWTFAVVHRNRPGVAHGEYDAYARRVEAQDKRRAIALRGSASGWSSARGDLRASATSGRAIANRHQLERHRAAASAAAAPTSTPLPSGVPLADPAQPLPALPPRGSASDPNTSTSEAPPEVGDPTSISERPPRPAPLTTTAVAAGALAFDRDRAVHPNSSWTMTNGAGARWSTHRA